MRAADRPSAARARRAAPRADRRHPDDLAVGDGGRLRGAARDRRRRRRVHRREEGRTAIDIPEVTRAEAGDPRTFLILGSDERYGDKQAQDQAALGHDPARPRRPGHQADRGDVAPARPEGQDPRRGHEQDQRRLRDRRAAQDGRDDQAPVRGRDRRGLPDQQRDQRELRRLPARGQLRRRRLRRRRPPLLQRQHDGGARRGLRDDRRAARLPAAQGPGRARLRPLPPRRQRLLPRLAPAGLPAPDHAPGRGPRAAGRRASARSSRTSSAATSRSTSPS